ncbi:hypothetical protein OE88DRAFT_1043255 [Heliocybe sulcata]|uniref:Uncharacterized protein n=1 Tax=Heliocybe sulcata TaxID=5364 RepID=A0A5C3MN42_9AGAM|nr:hypothetical protein OE88DRAFT_1043255 [Heliocybe sulcata]
MASFLVLYPHTVTSFELGCRKSVSSRASQGKFRRQVTVRWTGVSSDWTSIRLSSHGCRLYERQPNISVVASVELGTHIRPTVILEGRLHGVTSDISPRWIKGVLQIRKVRDQSSKPQLGECTSFFLECAAQTEAVVAERRCCDALHRAPWRMWHRNVSESVISSQALLLI